MQHRYMYLCGYKVGKARGLDVEHSGEERLSGVLRNDQSSRIDAVVRGAFVWPIRVDTIRPRGREW